MVKLKKPKIKIVKVISKGLFPAYLTGILFFMGYNLSHWQFYAVLIPSFFLMELSNQDF